MVLRSTFLLLVLAVVLSAVSFSGGPRQADAATDLTGSWTFDWNGAPGPYPIPCNTAALKQHGPDLYMYFTCPPGKVFSGTYDKGSGAFTVTTTVLCKGFIEIPLTLTGTVSLHGNSMSGTWSTICISPINGTFDADRSGPATVTITPPPSATPTETATPTATGLYATYVPPSPTPTPPPVGGLSLDPPSPPGDGAGPPIAALAVLGAGLAAVGVATLALRMARRA